MQPPNECNVMERTFDNICGAIPIERSEKGWDLNFNPIDQIGKKPNGGVKCDEIKRAEESSLP